MSSTCSNCESPKASLTCGLCAASLCKQCVEILGEDDFSFLPNPSADLKHDVYCRSCFEDKISGQLAEYNEVMDRARELRVFYKNQSKETSRIKRKALAVSIRDCADYNEAVLRLAFLAAQSGHNAVVDMDLTSKKVRDNGYQKTIWSGTALPVNLDAKRLAREELPDIGNPN